MGRPDTDPKERCSEDEALWPDPDLVKEGPESALPLLLEKVRPSVFRWVAGKTSDSDDAEDITQLVMLRVMTHLRTFRGECRFSSWL